MKRIVVYWSGTGNTEEIANKIASDLGCDVVNVNSTTKEAVLENDLIIMGCPAMGAEVLERVLFKEDNMSFLKSVGYDITSVDTMLESLKERIKEDSFPH